MTRTKQAAAKSSGKGKNVDLGTSSLPGLENPKSSKKKSVLAERGFNLENPSAEFLSTVAALGWEKFVVHRKEYIATLVRDFYEGMQVKSDGESSSISIVRGEEVKFNVRTINDYFGLGYYGKAIETKQRTYGVAEMTALKERICVKGVVWERCGDHGAEFKIQRKFLCDEANTWFHFIRHSLLPTSHTIWVDKERLIVIDAIMSRDKIEVGKLINREMNKWQNRKDSYLYFPCLITDLCMEAGVEIEADELREEPSGAFATNFKTRQRAGDATTLVDAQTLQRLVHQQNSLAKFVKQQFEWQKKVNSHSTKGKMVIEEPVLPDWMLEEDEEEDDVPISTMNLRAVKKEKAKRARSPAKKEKSPAKKKQKKVTYEEEEMRSSEMDSISEEDADESKKVGMEVLSEEEEEEQVEEEGSSSDKTDIQADSPPTPKQTLPQHSEPSTHTQNTPKTPQSKQQNQPTPQPSPIQPQPENQPSQQPPSQEKPTEDVVTSEAAAANISETQPISPPKRFRVKSVAKKRPFGRKARQELAAVSEETSDPDADVAQEAREKLPIKKKSVAPKGKPATATSAVFVASGGSEATSVADAEKESADVVTSAEREAAEKLAELQAAKGKEAKDVADEGAEEQAKDATVTGDESTDVPTSKDQEVVKAQVDPQEPVSVDPAELAKQKAWEEAKKRLAEHSAKVALEAAAMETSAAAAATSGVLGSEDTVVVEEEGKKKKEKKKKAQASAKPVRQSGRIKSGAVNK